jgi:hypothetical protein
MKLIKPVEKVVEVGSDELGWISLVSKGYITIAERQVISEAEATRPTEDQLIRDKAQSLIDRGFNYELGDLIDYISNREKLPQSLLKKLDRDKKLIETLKEESPEVRKEIVLNSLNTLKAFITQRMEDRDLAEYIDGLTLEEFANGNEQIKYELGDDVEVCGIGLKGLLDHLFYFYVAESKGTTYGKVIDGMGGKENLPTFF